MNSPIQWHLWSAEQIANSLPDLITKIESYREKFSEEHWKKNQAGIESLRTQPLTAIDVRARSRTGELITLGLALDALGRQIDQKGNIDESLALFQAAHELFRGGNTSLHPTKFMRQTLGNALQTILNHEGDRIRDGETDAGRVLETLNDFVTSAWGRIPPQLILDINEMLLTELERVRVSGEDDRTFHEGFVRNNIEVVLSIEIPSRLGAIQDQWQEIGEHVAPTATRTAIRAIQRPKILAALLSQDISKEIEQAIIQGDAEALRDTLAKVEDELETNLRLRLDAKAEYLVPISEVHHLGGPNRFFLEARELLLRQSPEALEKFRNLHFRNSNNPYAKEWYAYAMTRFGGAMEIHDVIEVLQDAISSEFFREHFGWPARWNLACALRRVPTRANEALDALLPLLKNDEYTAEAFELCLLWALEQNREDVLATLLPKSPHHEAHLLAALHDTQALTEKGNRSAFRDHFRRISWILRNLNYIFPDPKDDSLDLYQLDQLTRNFVQASLVAAGIEWFRQRVSYENHRNFFKNWECAAILNEEDDNLPVAWLCRQRQLECSLRSRYLDRVKKTSVLRFVLNWAEKNGFEEDALRILRKSWRDAGMPNSDANLWEERLKKTAPAAGPKVVFKAPDPDFVPSEPRPPSIPSITLSEAERTIQQLAGSFTSVSSAEELAVKNTDAERLLEATRFKHPDMSSDVVGSLREIVRLAVAFHEGVDEQEGQGLARRMKDQLEPLRRHRQNLHYELQGLAQTCERVAQNLAVRKAIPQLNITPPADLKVVLARLASGEKYISHVFSRIANPATEDARHLEVGFMTTSPCVRFLEKIATMTEIGPGEKKIVECPLEVSDGVEDEVEIRVHVTYEIGGVQRTTHASGRVPVRSLGVPIPVTQRYMTSAPVGTDRTDLFHGRDKELDDLLNAFAGGRLLKLYFVNGIRRVGKSTLMKHLGSRCSPDVLPLVLSVETALQSQNMNATQFVRQLIRYAIGEVRLVQGLPAVSLVVPGVEAFQLDPPWVVFDTFLEDLRRQTQRRNVLICFDEVQWLIKRIADQTDPMDDGFLAWLRDKAQKGSETLVVCTGSEPYAVMRKRYDHTLWGNMDAYNISFVEKTAMEKIATLPVRSDGVIWLPEALERLWDMTEGHPWVTQLLAEKITEQLNTEYRRLVGPADVDRATDVIASDSRISELWWNEKENLVTATHRQIAFLLLQSQPRNRLGLPESKLTELCQRGGIRTVGRYLEEMKSLEVLTEVKDGDEPHWRIRGAFLERHLMTLMQRVLKEVGVRPDTSLPNQPLALMIDWENAKSRLSKKLDEMPTSKADSLRPRLAGAELASRFLEAASRYGVPRQRWAVANWDKVFFSGDQMALKREGRYFTDMSGEDKDNASDHVLRERIHDVLREHGEIDIYSIITGDGDYGEAIKTLQGQGKRVILWATREGVNKNYKYYLAGPDRIQIEWLEDLIFGDELVPK